MGKNPGFNQQWADMATKALGFPVSFESVEVEIGRGGGVMILCKDAAGMGYSPYYDAMAFERIEYPAADGWPAVTVLEEVKENPGGWLEGMLGACRWEDEEWQTDVYGCY